MIKLLKISGLSAFLFCLAVQLNAQKFGHLNSGNLIAQMPEAAMADSILKIYQDSLVKDGQAKADAFRKDVAEYQSKLQENINAVGKEKGYTMIFDTSIFNAVLFSQDSDDIEPLVKAKMGFE